MLVGLTCLYFDTSALVALYVEDRCTRQAQATWRDAGHVATSSLAYAETLSAFAQLRRRKGLGALQHERATAKFLADWPTFHRVRPLAEGLTPAWKASS